MIKPHFFHIPVMGLGYTVDTPLKVSQFGIDSVIAIGDDILLEKLRKMYCAKFSLPFKDISKDMEDFRAKRITSYLNMINELASKKFEEMKSSFSEKSKEIKTYFDLLPTDSQLKMEFSKLSNSCLNFCELKKWLKSNLKMGSIDVNILTKADKENYIKNEKLPVEFNDAHAALRGFALSNLNSSIVLSAGMNPRLYSYMEQFEDFFPDENGAIKKKITLKVSDYRSALIQGKFLAKKGLWVSEFRIESGLNCGGHAFATDGLLMGPILAEFRDQRESLYSELHQMVLQAWERKGLITSKSFPEMRVSAQGGVGTYEEQQFLLDHYQVDSVGWGTPFLLVPEVTNVDDKTLKLLEKADESDLYLSGISPLGVPFNNLRGNTKDLEKLEYISKGRPGSPCPKRHLALNKEFSEKGQCTSSRQYQHLKILELKKEQLPQELYEREYNKVIEKSCICVGLGTSALLVNGIDTKTEGTGVSICPGPNLAYFSKKMSLLQMVNHIYGRENHLNQKERPNMFIKELHLYIENLKNKIEEAKFDLNKQQEKLIIRFNENLEEGIKYYSVLFKEFQASFGQNKTKLIAELENSLVTLRRLSLQFQELHIKV